jgi:phosphotriesterase-related protein
MSNLTSFSFPRPINTVQGPISYDDLGITDCHNHIWIDPVPGVEPNSPALNQINEIELELLEYKRAGGQSLLDCQPEGCGRNSIKLLELSQKSDVNVIACTGFHRQKYYPPQHWLFAKRAQKVCDFLSTELEIGMFETLDLEKPIKAGFIKIALEAAWGDCPQAALEGTAFAAKKTGALIEIHTEKGALAEKACLFFTDSGVAANQIVLCHMDKRPDYGLQKELARLGVLLEYDTFYRPKYEPEKNLWPLIDHMVENDLAGSVALATDMAEAALYHHLGGGPGLHSLPNDIKNKLQERGISNNDVTQMIGGNIARRLAGTN